MAFQVSSFPCLCLMYNIYLWNQKGSWVTQPAATFYHQIKVFCMWSHKSGQEEVVQNGHGPQPYSTVFSWSLSTYTLIRRSIKSTSIKKKLCSRSFAGWGRLNQGVDNWILTSSLRTVIQGKFPKSRDSPNRSICSLCWREMSRHSNPSSVAGGSSGWSGTWKKNSWKIGG